MTDRQFIVDNFAYRLSIAYPDHSINVGTGNLYHSLVVIHPSHGIPDRDGTSGALKRFGLSSHAYRMPMEIVKGLDQEENRRLVAELLEILQPLFVVASGYEVAEFLKNETTQPPKSQSWKDFEVSDLTNFKFCGILHPEEYSFARAPAVLKEQGKREWESVTNTFRQLLHQYENQRWKA